MIGAPEPDEQGTDLMATGPWTDELGGPEPGEEWTDLMGGPQPER